MDRRFMCDYQELKKELFPDIDFHPVVRIPKTARLLDLSRGNQAGHIQKIRWGIGRFDEKRPGMYTAPQYENRRNIHMGIDIWSPEGAPVYAAWEGEIAHRGNNDQRGNYGPTIVLRHQIGETRIYALHGHLSRSSLAGHSEGDILAAAEVFAHIGGYAENGNWEPHLHYQLSWKDPGGADMPGVVSDEDHEEALELYPDPRLILGPIY